MQKVPTQGGEGYNAFYSAMYYARLLRAAGKIEQRIADLRHQLTLPQSQAPGVKERLEAELAKEEIKATVMNRKKENARRRISLEDLSCGA